jgi:hypothetical protein
VITALASIAIPVACRATSQVEAFEGTIGTLRTTQLLTSWAIMIAGSQAYPNNLLDPHAFLAVVLALLAHFSSSIPFWIARDRIATGWGFWRGLFMALQSTVILFGIMFRTGYHIGYFLKPLNFFCPRCVSVACAPRDIKLRSVRIKKSLQT